MTNDFCVCYSGSGFNLDCDWSSHLLHHAAVRRRWSLCDIQKEVRSLTDLLSICWKTLTDYTIYDMTQRANGVYYVYKPMMGLEVGCSVWTLSPVAIRSMLQDKLEKVHILLHFSVYQMLSVVVLQANRRPNRTSYRLLKPWVPQRQWW